MISLAVLAVSVSARTLVVTRLLSVAVPTTFGLVNAPTPDKVGLAIGAFKSRPVRMNMLNGLADSAVPLTLASPTIALVTR